MPLSILTQKQVWLPRKTGMNDHYPYTTFKENSEVLEPLRKKMNQGKELRIPNEKKWTGRNKYWGIKATIKFKWIVTNHLKVAMQ